MSDDHEQDGPERDGLRMGDATPEQIEEAWEDVLPLLRQASRQILSTWRRVISSQFGEEAAASVSAMPPLSILEPGDEQLSQVDVLARGLAKQWKPHTDQARRELRARAKREGREIRDQKIQLARSALFAAAADLDRPQHVRFGNRWVLDDDGHKATLTPRDDLHILEAVRWYAQAAKAAMTADLRKESWPVHEREAFDLDEAVPLEEAIHVADVTPGPLEEMIFRHEPTVVEKIASDDLTPALRKLLDAYLYTGSWPEAARELGITLSAMRNRKQRLRAALDPP